MYEVRLLIKQSEVGPIIGTRGANVKRIRDEACVFASIVKEQNTTGLTERIMTIKGEVENIAKGVWILCQILIDAAQQREDYKAKNRAKENGDGKAVTVDKYQIKFLCHQFQVGGIIGKQGSIIKQTKEQTGAIINVSNEPLGNSTDKSVSLTGSADVIYNATLLIVQQLKDNILKSGVRDIKYTPGSNPAQQFTQVPQYRPQYNPYGSAPQQQQFQPQFQPQQQQQQQFQPQQQQFQPQQQYGNQFASGSQETQSITIPKICASAVIGRGGSIISDIRQQSGTFISIAKPEVTSPDKRVVAITGTQQQIQVAISMIRQIVENFQE